MQRSFSPTYSVPFAQDWLAGCLLRYVAYAIRPIAPTVSLPSLFFIMFLCSSYPPTRPTNPCLCRWLSTDKMDIKDSLGGNCRTLLVACVWPRPELLVQSLATLKFAARMRGIKNAPVVNERPCSMDEELSRYTTSRKPAENMQSVRFCGL